MNKRIFLFGLGIGIILGAGLLQLMLIGEKQADALNDAEPAARTYTQAELDKAVSDERGRIEAERNAQPASAVKSDKPAQPADEQVSEPAVKTDTKHETSERDPDASKPSRIIVRIPPNASVAETAALLSDRGVIPDTKAFIDLMRKKTIRAGYFAFQGKLTLKQVGGIITSQPLDPEKAKNEMAASGG
ncbi:hypothetical protein [Paenibacillus glycinis]|uniref:Aminodeoxychorismate lyase n=1 Tax=Paenibacillus glycinis TaxID=2697035 RepID=A0ABW9XIZ2_9BACL|nr:hypothetical protein [Paenibacillus glycinis]NBD22439.1 hypothetical protein [Paenibacillus glycinis]